MHTKHSPIAFKCLVTRTVNIQERREHKDVTILQKPHTTRDQTKCLHICVPGSGTAKIYCTFGQQTVTCEETHARNADKTQKNGTYLENGVNRPTCHEWRCSTHVIGSDAQLTNNIHTKQRNYSNNTPHHEDLVAVRTSQSSHGIVCEMVQQCRMHVAPSNGQLRQQFGHI